MSKACSVANCQLKSKVTFHSPQSRPHLELWKKILKINVDNFYVCDQHFEEKFFRIEKRLTIDAFPTQYVGHVEPGDDEFCQCCMKSFVRSKFITQNEPRMAIDEKIRKDFVEVVGCELPDGVICSKCFESIANFSKFRSEIRDKQKIRDEILELKQSQEFQLDPSIKIKEEPKDPDEYESMDMSSIDPDFTAIKDEPMDEEYVIKQEKIDIETDESFLISEIKTEPEEMSEAVTKPVALRMANPALRPKIVIKRPNNGIVVRPANFQNFKVVQPQKLVRVVRNPTAQPDAVSGSVHKSTKISNSQGTIKISQVQLTQMENSTNMLGYKCQYCPNRFIERRFVVEHIKQKHTFPCPQCNSVFPFKITLIKHQMSMHGSQSGAQGTKTPNYKYICRICGLKFLSSYTLDAHMLQKHQRTLIGEKINSRDENDDNIIIIRPLVMPSKASSQSSQSSSATTSSPLPMMPKIPQPSTSEMRIKSESSDKQPVKFKIIPNLKQVNSIKAVQKPVTTLIRKILTPTAYTLPPPPEPIEEDPDGIPCLDCGLLLKPDKLLKHRMDAHDLDTHNIFYLCDLCGIEIKGKTQLINHMTLKHLSSNYVRCEFCDGLFENITEVICHKNLQHNFNGTRYTCHFCYKIFHNKREMILHRKAHYSEKDSRQKLARVFCKKFKSYEPKGREYN